MAAALSLLALVPLIDGGRPTGWLLGVAAVFAGLAAASPRALRPLNIAWTRLGLLIGRVTNPVLLAIVFYGAVVPTGLIMRAVGRDPMRRKRDPRAASYWIPRDSGQTPMTRQF